MSLSEKSPELAKLHEQTALVEDEGISLTWSIHEIYTSRCCDELAAVLVGRIPDSEIVHVRMVGTWPGGYLLQAGVHRDDRVYDIEGVHDIDDWVARWGRGGEIEVHFRDGSSQLNTFANKESEALANRVADELMAVPEFANAGVALEFL